ncbi:helix-turn-helix domain-containing protein [Micromonospora sp. DT233]|uniref:helix-turn-helix domain-containing protein n=1 Tax=Micromonospora sp. DT233 TaxID=3393432 RepID=UPI003CEE7086
MPARNRAIVDPQFPAELSRLRRERGLSLRELARTVYYGKSYLHDLETGRIRPTREVAEHLDRALAAGGALAAMVIDPPPIGSADDAGRMAYVIARPTRLDAQAVEVFTDVLAAQRRLDDVVVAQLMLPGAVAQWRTVQAVADQARGPHAERLRPVAAEWTQFVGWLHAEARHDTQAVEVLTEAAEQADAVDGGELAAQAENFRGYLARQQGRPRGIVRHFLAAYHTPGAAPLQRVGDAVQAAHGYALLGDRAAAVRLLGEASDLTESAGDEPPPATAYWLTPSFCRMGLGLAYLALGDRAAAAGNLRAGLDELPEEQREAEWTAEYRRALAVAG